MAKRKKAAPVVAQVPEIEPEVPAVIDPTPPETPDVPMTEPEAPVNETIEPAVDSPEQSQEKPPERPPEEPHASKPPAYPPLNDFIKQVEREAQERYGLAITRIAHPEAKEGSVYQGTYAGIPLSQGEPGMLLSDGRGFGSLDRDE